MYAYIADARDNQAPRGLDSSNEGSFGPGEIGPYSSLRITTPLSAPSSNFGSLAAAEQRWRASAAAGVDYIASDQYEELQKSCAPEN